MACGCAEGKFDEGDYETRSLGNDRYHAEASLMKCRGCGKRFLKYSYEEEGFDGSRRWWCGEVTSEQAAKVSAETAGEVLGRIKGWWKGGPHWGATTKGSGEPSVM